MHTLAYMHEKHTSDNLDFPFCLPKTADKRNAYILNVFDRNESSITTNMQKCRV